MPALALLFNALVWGLSWWPFRELQSQGLHPLWATALIFCFALVCLLCFKPNAWRGLLQQPLLWLLMLASGLTNVGFNWAVTEGDVVRVVLLFYLMPAWVVLLAWPILSEKPSPASLLQLLIAGVGLVVVLKTPESAWPLPESWPDWLALFGGLCFALTNILLRKLNQTPSSARTLAMFSGCMLMALATALLGQHLGIVSAPPAPNISWLGLTLLLSLIFLAGTLCLQYGASRLRASNTALIMLSEVVFASASSVLLGASELSMRSLIGGALILFAATLAAWPRAPTPITIPTQAHRDRH